MSKPFGATAAGLSPAPFAIPRDVMALGTRSSHCPFPRSCCLRVLEPARGAGRVCAAVVLPHPRGCCLRVSPAQMRPDQMVWGRSGWVGWSTEGGAGDKVCADPGSASVLLAVGSKPIPLSPHLEPRSSANRSISEDGSGGRIRTYDRSVNSRLLYH